MGMSYPQFVEVLVLLAASAARRLRNLYPDAAGEPAPRPTKRPPRNSESVTISGATSSRNDSSPCESKSKMGVEPIIDVDREAKETMSNPAQQPIQRRAIDVRAAMRLKTGRFVQTQKMSDILFLFHGVSDEVLQL